ncbi:MAG: sugar ABC transporter substrate-binding protein [Acidimicrobiales bacterium]
MPLAVVLAACSSTSSSSTSTSAASGTTTPKLNYTIGFSNPQGTQPVLDSFQKALTTAATREGITVDSLNAGLTVSKQVSDIQQFINEKVKAIVVFPLAGPPLAPVLTSARKAGILVLGYNAITTATATPSAIYPYNADINQGLINQGAKLLSAYMVQTLHGTGNILGVGIAAPVPSLHAFMAAIQADVTNGHPNMHWLETVADQTDNIAGAAAPVADALTKYHNKIDGIMAYFDGAAIGAAQSVKAAGTKSVITGQQGNTTGIAAIKSGEISATLNELPYNQALIALTMVKDLVAGKTATVPTVVHPTIALVTKANVGKYVSWNTEIAKIASGTLVPPTKVTATGTTVTAKG